MGPGCTKYSVSWCSMKPCNHERFNHEKHEIHEPLGPLDRLRDHRLGNQPLDKLGGGALCKRFDFCFTTCGGGLGVDLLFD